MSAADVARRLAERLTARRAENLLCSWFDGVRGPQTPWDRLMVAGWMPIYGTRLVLPPGDYDRRSEGLPERDKDMTVQAAIHCLDTCPAEYDCRDPDYHPLAQDDEAEYDCTLEDIHYED